VHRPHVKLLAAMQGRLGLDLAREHRPDLILLDLHLPDISGEDVLTGLRAQPELKDIPVIVISADATRGRIERLMSMGVLDYLPKPLDIKRFLKLLDACLSGMDSK
jgi:DNA-binding response OmpR family regulator